MKVQGAESSFIPVQLEPKTIIFPERQVHNQEKARPAENTESNEKSRTQHLEMEEAVEQANKTLETYNTELRFSIHKESGEITVKVINTNDHSVIREIPPERVLDFVARVKKMLGVIIDKLI